MKKRILLVVLAVCIVFAVVACAPMNDAQVKEALKKAEDEINKDNSGINVSIDMEDDKVYYRMKMETVEPSMVDDAMKENLKKMIEEDPQMKASLEAGFELIKAGINRKDIVMVLEICASNGEVLVSQEY